MFEIPGTIEVVKRAKHGYQDDLWRDYVAHTRIQETFEQWKSLTANLRVPRCYDFIAKDDTEYWSELVSMFPTKYEWPTAVLFSERILPLSQSIRYGIIDSYFPEKAKTEAKANQANRDCLIRVYLGKRRNPHRFQPPVVSLRNYNLCLDQMEELNLATDGFAALMARGLALLHWGACLDADDVEFVLGTMPNNSQGRFALCSSQELEKLEGPATTLPKRSIPNFHRSIVSMYLLDFNRCKKIHFRKTIEHQSAATLQNEALQMMVDAFFRNDPYYPRPLSSNQHEQSLWSVFETTYLNVAATVLSGDDEKTGVQALPKRFMEMLERTMEERLRKKAEATKRLESMGDRGWEEEEEVDEE